MTTNGRQESAQIFQFPRRPATAAGLRRFGTAVADPRQPPVPSVEFGSGWYHDVAVQEAERNRKP